MSAALLRAADLEMQDHAGTFCQSCGAAADDENEPYCRQCASYWKDCREGLWDDDWRMADAQ